MILHIPHSSTYIPSKLREQFMLSDDELASELLVMTDAYTDELFARPDYESIVFPFSRLLVDVERFSDNEDEPMSKVGMGMVYNKTSYGRNLRRQLSSAERTTLKGYYDKHHRLLTDSVTKELQTTGRALIIDCHSFPNKPMPCNSDQATPRPDICIGTDLFHTPEALTDAAASYFRDSGFSVGINTPFSGSIVPMEFYGSNPHVHSIMIEVNRSLYMNEITGSKLNSLGIIQDKLHKLLSSL